MEGIKPGTPNFLILPYFTPVFSFILESIQISQHVLEANKHKYEFRERVNTKDVDQSENLPLTVLSLAMVCAQLQCLY